MMSRRALVATLFVIAVGLPSLVRAQGSPPPNVGATLFQNVRIFDGKGTSLSAPSNVLVKGNIIERISAAPITAEPGVTVVAGGGRTLMPGLIDNHWHAMLIRVTPAESFGDVGYNNLTAAAEATDTLMRGFTTVRDVGGPAFGLKRAIDEGIVKGPRIYPSGAVITVTSGHGDFRQLTELPRTIGGMLSRMEQIGASMVADTPDEVRIRTREQLMQGASQIKLTAGGGVSSPFSPIDVSTFTEPELRAAVEAAENWGTYVTVHAFTPAAIQRSIAAGVKCIEHGFLMDDATAKLMAEKGIWLSTQPLPEGLRLGFPVGSVQRERSSPRLPAGTRPPKRWSWQHRQTPNCWRCPASAIPIPASLAWWKRAPLPTCFWSTAIRLKTSIWSRMPPGTSWSS
jgi:imidazolonepropionase-like amidohydrolase